MTGNGTHPEGRRRTRMPVLAVIAAAAALALCACTSPSPSASAGVTPSAGASVQQLSAKDAAAEILGTRKALPVLGSATGTITGPGVDSAVIEQVLAVRASAASTVVIWRLKSASGARVDAASFQLAHAPLTDTRLLGVVDTATKTTYRPYTYYPAQGNGEDLGCACSKLPQEVDGTGEVLYAVVPPLPTSVTKVSITLPGFGTVKDVPVTRDKG